jgi:hypothetical protein
VVAATPRVRRVDASCTDRPAKKRGASSNAAFAGLTIRVRVRVRRRGTADIHARELAGRIRDLAGELDFGLEADPIATERHDGKLPFPAPIGERAQTGAVESGLVRSRGRFCRGAGSEDVVGRSQCRGTSGTTSSACCL